MPSHTVNASTEESKTELNKTIKAEKPYEPKLYFEPEKPKTVRIRTQFLMLVKASPSAAKFYHHDGNGELHLLRSMDSKNRCIFELKVAPGTLKGWEEYVAKWNKRSFSEMGADEQAKFVVPTAGEEEEAVVTPVPPPLIDITQSPPPALPLFPPLPPIPVIPSQASFMPLDMPSLADLASSSTALGRASSPINIDPMTALFNHPTTLPSSVITSTSSPTFTASSLLPSTSKLPPLPHSLEAILSKTVFQPTASTSSPSFPFTFPTLPPMFTAAPTSIPTPASAPIAIKTTTLRSLLDD